MKEFFKSELKDLEFKTGYRQYEKLLERAEWEKDLNKLLNELCFVCDQFPFIEDSDKQKIIQGGIIADPDFQGFNARIVYKWLAQNQQKYFKQMAHMESKQEQGEPVTGEKRDEWLKKWMATLGEVTHHVSPISQAELDAASERPMQGHPYPKTSDEYYVKRDLHLQYVRENYDKLTGKPLSTWVSEDDWLKRVNKTE